MVLALLVGSGDRWAAIRMASFHFFLSNTWLARRAAPPTNLGTVTSCDRAKYWSLTFCALIVVSHQRRLDSVWTGVAPSRSSHLYMGSESTLGAANLGAQAGQQPNWCGRRTWVASVLLFFSLHIATAASELYANAYKCPGQGSFCATDRLYGTEAYA